MFKVIPVSRHLWALRSSKCAIPCSGVWVKTATCHQKTSVRNHSFETNNSIFTYISECAPTEYARQFLISVHDYSGLPWWATVVCTTVFFRTCITLPLAVYQHNILAKIENLSMLEMPEIAKEVKLETARKAREFHWTEKRASLKYKIELKKRWDQLIVRDNCHPFKGTITLWFQLPAWIFFSSALRNLTFMLPFKDGAAQVIRMQLAVGGLLWIPNLTQPDGLLILPLVLGLSNLAIIEMQVLKRLKEPTKLQRYATNFFRIFSIAMIPISATIPSLVCLYWTTSSIMGVGQNLLLMSNKFRSFCRIPDTPTTLDHPYLQLASDMQTKAKSITRMLARK